jgi:chemotaxis protein methyltransferase CheR
MSGHGASLQTDLSREDFERFVGYIREHSGIHVEESRADALRISLVTRATRFGLDSFDRYYELLTVDEGEFRELMNLITINETSFFRFAAQFEALRTVVVPEILDARSSAVRSFRVWSAGCSTGEEPYSIAMTLLDAGIESLGHRAEVLGTDVSTSALERAESGVYPPRALLNVPREVVTHYFEPTATGHRVTDQVRRVVDFRYQNLVREPYPTATMGGWDVIFCRNVTIYFRIESTRRVIDNLFESLNPGGYLFIGHSETLTGITDRFETVEVDGVFLHRKPLATTSMSFPELVETRLRKGTDAKPVEETPRLRPPAAAVAGRPHEVPEAARGIPESVPDSAETHLLAARAYADNGDFDDALGSAREALRLDPLLAAARYILGLIYLRTGQTDEAIAEFKRTVYADDTFVLAHLNLGNLCRARGDYAEACREYEDAKRALERAPEGPWSAFLGGFEPELLAKTCERSLRECHRLRETP